MATAIRGGATRTAIAVYVSQTEQWKGGDEANSSLDFEELVALGNSIFDAISRWDTVLHTTVNRGVATYDQTDAANITKLYGYWHSVSSRVLEGIVSFERRGLAVLGAELFRRNCEDAEGILEDCENVVGEDLREHERAAMDDHRNGRTKEFTELGD
jgi:hypothetical protein